MDQCHAVYLPELFCKIVRVKKAYLAADLRNGEIGMMEKICRTFQTVFDSYDFIQGELTWNFADFQTSEGIFRVNGNKKGVFTRTRQPKESAFILKKRWAEKN